MTRHRAQPEGLRTVAVLDDIDKERRDLMEHFRKVLLMPDIIDMAYDENALFSRLVRTAVSEFGVKPAALAERVRNSPAAISRWMNGKATPPAFTREGVLRAIARLIEEGLEESAPHNVAAQTLASVD